MNQRMVTSTVVDTNAEKGIQLMSERRTSRIKNREPRKTKRGFLARGQKRRRGRRHRRRIVWKRFLPAMVLLAIFLYGMVNLICYAVQSASTKKTNAELVQMYERAEAEAPLPSPVSTPASTPQPTPTPQPVLLDTYQYMGNAFLPSAEELYKKNRDLVAWLRIPGVVNLPVVYRDNTYYLDHDFNGKKSSSGTLFLDEAHPLWEDTQYMVIHGHDMHDGSMFGYLTHYRKRNYMEEHPTVYFNTLYRKEEYDVIGVLQLPEDVQDAGYVAFTGTRKFKNLDHFHAFADSIKGNALYWKAGAEMLPSDALLALSTCHGDDQRIVVMCRRTVEDADG